MITPRASHSIWRWLLIGLGFLLSAPLLFALDPSHGIFDYNIRTWNRQNGLPFNRIRSITQTADGFLWMGTQNGLARFDGIDFAHVAIPNRSGWHSVNVVSIRSSPRGGLWFGMDGGGFGYFDGTNSFESVPGDLAASIVTPNAVEEDANGTLCIGAQKGFTAFIGGSTNKVYTNDLGLVQTIYTDPVHRVWVGSFEKGLFYWDNGKLNLFPNRDLMGVNIRSITMDHDGRLWVGTSWGLRCYDRTGKRDDMLPIYVEVPALLTDSHNVVWIGTSGDGLYRWANGQLGSLRKTNGLAEDYINSLYEDREGSIWIGCRDGVTQISDLKFPNASTASGPLNVSVHGICNAATGGIWCATSAGIYNYKDQSMSLLPASTNANPYVKRVFEARNGDLYALSGLREISIFYNGQLVGLHSNTDWPTALTEDDKGMIVSVGATLLRVDRHKMTPYALEDPNPQFYWIRNLSTAADGSLLVATVNGIFRIVDGRIDRHWTTNEGLSDLDVTCSVEDNEHTLWVGTASGLSRIRNNHATAIHLGTPDPLISAIVPDDLGNLWVSCSLGVIRANRQNLNDFADGKTARLDTKLYDGVDALRTIDLTEVENVGCKTADGKVWFAGPLGALQIDPAHIPTDTVPPPVLIEKVVINGVSYSGSAAVSQRRGGGELLFQYAGLSFISPQKIRFRYKLEGFDKDWIEAGSQRSAMYANVPPGTYRFDVRACNVDGVWSTEAASFVLKLPPLFYQTLWFKFAIAGAIVLCLLGLYGWRTRHLRQKEKSLQAANELLERKIGERTRELAEGRQLLRTLIDNLPDGVFVKDLEGRVIIDNVAHAHYLGFENTSQSIGKTDFDCFPRDRAEEFRRPEVLLLESGKEYDAEEYITLKNGETRWLRTTKVPLRDQQGKIIGLAGINRDITDRKKWEAELESLHKQLVETSRHAGMAEVATSVLHNVGNVLNSVNVSASIVDEQVRASSLERLEKAIELLKENRSNLAEFLGQDGKGAKLISYLDAILGMMKKERTTVQSEVEALSKNIEHIKKIVSMQQSYARVAGVMEIISPVELLEDSLRLHEAAFHRHAIKLVRDYSEVPKISVDRHKVIQILVNLLGNAKYACDVNEPNNRIIRLCVSAPAADRVRIEVIDNGMGIPAENLTRIFSYGFTTRKTGHGFGLHSGALAAKEMGGSLTAHSEGRGKGAAFIVELPLEHKPANAKPSREETLQLESAKI